MSGDQPVDKPTGPGGEPAGDLSKIRDYLGSSAGEYSALSGEPGQDAGDHTQQQKRSNKSPNNVEHDRFDGRLYGELHEACEEVRKLETAEGAFGTFPELLSDFFYSFYKAAPRIAAEESVEEAQRKTNRPFVERLLEDDETRRTRVNTRLDDMSAALAALAAGEKVLEEIADRQELSEFVRQSPPGDEDGQTENAQTAEDPAEQGEEPASGAPPSPPPRDLRRAIRAAAEAGAEDAEATEEAMQGWGLSAADLTSVPLGERIELARSLRNPRFKHLFDLVGRMRNLARAKGSENVKSRQDELHSVELSGDLSRMLPSELAAGLASPSRARRLDFYRRFIEGEVLSYELTANEPQAKGPIVAAIDCSASMSGASMEWATAVALALVDLASGGGGGQDQRPAALVFFNEAVKKVVRFAPGERDPRKLLEVATTGAAGGTRYEPAWKQMFTLCGESENAGADMLFVTDGICRVSEEFEAWILEEKSRLGAAAYSVLMGPEASGGERELERYSDEVWQISDLASDGDGAAAEIFGRLT